ncbi:hypothetical protein CUMW_083690 [Citrus unshiu]|nr:hypothetical protein CUMW_083690 [Citrus unshiu]
MNSEVAYRTMQVGGVRIAIMQIVAAFMAFISHTRAFIKTSTATRERMTVERMVDFYRKLGTGFMNRKFAGATTSRNLLFGISNGGRDEVGAVFLAATHRKIYGDKTHTKVKHKHT